MLESYDRYRKGKAIRLRRRAGNVGSSNYTYGHKSIVVCGAERNIIGTEFVISWISICFYDLKSIPI